MVYLPAFGSNGRVDLIAERSGELVRVQCKTACQVGGSLRFWTTSNTGNQPVPYVGEVDVFGVYAPSTDLVYVVPASDVPTRACFLRVEETTNRQRARVRWAVDYELGPP